MGPIATAAAPRPWEFRTRLPLARTLEGLLGLEITERKSGKVSGRIAIHDHIRQPMGYVHGGVVAAVAEALASIGTLDAVAGDGSAAVSLANTTSFFRPVTDGTLHAVAAARHTGDSTWVWDVEVSDDDARLCAMSQVTVAVGEAAQRALGGAGCAGA